MAATWDVISPAFPRSRRSVQALTEAAPASASDGIDLSGLASVVVVVHAPVGQTFTSAGSLLGYVFSNGVWVPHTEANIDFSYVTGLQDGALGPALPVKSPRDRFALIASGVGLSGAGTQITLELMCVLRAGLGSAV